MFDFNDSLNDVVPVSPISLPAHENRNEKSELLIDVFYVFSFFCLLPLRLSFMIVVFDFNGSLSTVIPFSPITVSIKQISETTPQKHQ